MIPRDQLNKSILVELLQQYAVEHLTTFRQLESRDPHCTDVVITTDFEALYTYKRGDILRCLELSTFNVSTLVTDAGGHYPQMPNIFTFPEIIGLD